MKRTHRVARKVQALLPGEYARSGPIVFNPYYEYIINGFIIDGTPYKNTVVVRRLQHVFFEADPLIRLTYSTSVYNLADPTKIVFFEGHVDDLAAQIAMTLISSGAAAEMLEPYTLQHFIDQKWPVPVDDIDAHHLFELACARFLVGDVERAKASFRTQKRLLDTYFAEHKTFDNPVGDLYYRDNCRAVALLDGDNTALRQFIIDIVTRNAGILGFNASGTGPHCA